MVGWMPASKSGKHCRVENTETVDACINPTLIAVNTECSWQRGYCG